MNSRACPYRLRVWLWLGGRMRKVFGNQIYIYANFLQPMGEWRINLNFNEMPFLNRERRRKLSERFSFSPLLLCLKWVLFQFGFGQIVLLFLRNSILQETRTALHAFGPTSHRQEKTISAKNVWFQYEEKFLWFLFHIFTKFAYSLTIFQIENILQFSGSMDIVIKFKKSFCRSRRVHMSLFTQF